MSLIGMMPVVNITNKTIKVVTIAKFIPKSTKPLMIFVLFLTLPKPTIRLMIPAVSVAIKPPIMNSGPIKISKRINKLVLNAK